MNNNHQHNLFLKFTSLSVQEDFYNAISFKSDIYYNEEKGICQECLWSYLKKNPPFYLYIEKFIVATNCQLVCWEAVNQTTFFTRDLQWNQENYIFIQNPNEETQGSDWLVWQTSLIKDLLALSSPYSNEEKKYE